MNRPVIVAAAVGLALLAGCGDPVEPSPPPTSEDALTTTSDAATETEAAPTTEAPQTEEPEAQGPPEMPEEATEQTEAGAEAFVEFYIDTLSAVHMDQAKIDDLRALGGTSCKTCTAFVDAAEKQRFGHAYVDVIETQGLLLDDEARVEAVLEQVKDSSAVDTVFTLAWKDEQWEVSEIQLSAG